MRLVDGELPAYPIFIVDSLPVNTFYADDLVALRQADAEPVLARQHGFSPQEVEAERVLVGCPTRVRPGFPGGRPSCLGPA